MKESKNLRIISFVLEASFLGSIILYIYNYYIATKKYEIIPSEVKNRLNIFIIIAIVTFILFLIVKYILYLRSRLVVAHNEEQLQFDFKEPDKETVYKNLEAPVTERVFIYNNDYEIPKERQTKCPNCGSIIDKNAHLCLKCGYLVRSIVQERIVEKVVTKPTYVPRKPIDRNKMINLLINVCLITGILITLALIIDLAIQRGIIG